MKKKFLSLVLLLQLTIICSAQKSDFFLSGGLHVPLGDFSTTHWLGTGLEIFSINYKCDTAVKQKKFSFTYKAGGVYYFAGQRQVVSGFTYNNPSYAYFYVSGGLLYRPAKRLNVMMTGGPAISIYKKHTRFNLVGDVSAFYFIHCNLSAGPGLYVIKEPGTNALWALALKLNFRL